MTTNLNFPKPVKPDDGCNWLPVILWRMNAGARARIARHDDMPVVHFTLNSVDPRYYIESAKNKRA